VVGRFHNIVMVIGLRCCQLVLCGRFKVMRSFAVMISCLVVNSMFMFCGRFIPP
jgi:hypothetical protein